jgi:PAS domain S-box-containing protein
VALRESEERCRFLFQESIDAVLLIGPKGRILAANPAACRLLGRSEEELRRVGLTGVVDPADSHLAVSLEERIGTGRFRGELPLVRGDGTRLLAELSTMTYKDKDGRDRTSMIVRDTAMRKQAEEGLRQSEAELAEAQRVAKLGSWSFDLATNALRWSKELYRVFDLEETTFGNTYEAFLSRVHPDDRPRVLQANAEARAGGKPFELEYRVLARAGQVKTIREIGYAVKDATGKVMSLFGTAQDITERKRSEEALQQTNAKLQAILGASPIPILGVSADGRIESWNEAAEHVFGWSAKEAIGRLCPTITPREMEDYLAMIRQAMRGEPSLGLVRYRQKKSGVQILCRVSAAPQRNAQGQPVGVTVLLEDVTEREQAAAALRESEERLRLLDDNLPDSYVYQFTRDADGTPRFLYLSSGVERVHGVKTEAGVRDAALLRDQTAPEQRAALAEAEAASLRHLSDFEMELRVCRADGQWRWVQMRSSPRRNADGQVIWDGVATDITERKQVEDALRDSEERFSGAFNSAAIGMALVTPEGRWLQVNRALCAHLGYSETELLAATFQDITHPDDLEKDLAYVRQMLSGEIQSYQMEKRYIHKSGGIVWGLLSVSLVRTSQGTPRYFISQIQDVTARKQVEEALIESEAKFRVLADGTASAIFIYQGDHYCYVNPAFQAMTGYSEAELRKMNFWDVAHPEFRELVRTRGLARQQGKHPPMRYEFKILAKSGEERWLDFTDGAIEFQGRPAALGTALDITERKRAEETIRRQFVEIAYYYDNAPIGLAVLDTDLRYLRINKQLVEINGIPSSEHIGKTVNEIIPSLAAQARAVAAEIIRTGRPVKDREFTGETAAQPGIPRVWLEGWYPLLSDDRKVTGFIVIVEDVTERKQTEAALRQSREQLRALLARLQRLREEERCQIAREVHDVLGQLLTALKLDMSWWERRFTRITDEPLRRALEEKVEATSRLTDMMIDTVQKISRELRPSVLDNIGLGAALQFEARQFQERTGIACEVSVPAQTFVLDPDRTTGMFRVFQELLTNVARHAQATRVVVSLNQSAESVTLEVKDNGRGIHEEELRDPKSLGILGMAERASLMGGRLEIHGRPGQGTTGVLTIPAKRG